MKVPGSLQRIAFVLATAVLLAGCTSATTNKVGSAEPKHSVASAPQLGSGEYPVTDPQAANGGANASAMASADLGDYRISPNDSLQISVFQVPDLNHTVMVNADGTITLPLIGKVPLAGKTTHEAEEIIADRLRKKYLQSPQVSVAVAKFGQRVTVGGAVKSPRVLAVDGQLTLSQAVANAGGLSDTANSTQIHVARRDGQHVQDEIYNLSAIQAGRNIDPKLEGGDLVVAEESGTKVAFKNVKDLLPFAILANVF